MFDTVWLCLVRFDTVWRNACPALSLLAIRFFGWLVLPFCAILPGWSEVTGWSVLLFCWGFVSLCTRWIRFSSDAIVSCDDSVSFVHYPLPALSRYTLPMLYPLHAVPWEL